MFIFWCLLVKQIQTFKIAENFHMFYFVPIAILRMTSKYSTLWLIRYIAMEAMEHLWIIYL